jgi:hypothetical protein
LPCLFFCSDFVKKKNRNDVLTRFFSYLSLHSLVFFCVSDELWIERKTERSAQYMTRI